jgi:uncharacterized RmlC-like cupin family protein
MVPFDKQTVTVVRQSKVGVDTEIMLEAGDFAYIPSGAIHVIANASQSEEASLVFCYIGVPNVEASGNVWLTKEHDAFVAPRSSS